MSNTLRTSIHDGDLDVWTLECHHAARGTPHVSCPDAANLRDDHCCVHNPVSVQLNLYTLYTKALVFCDKNAQLVLCHTGTLEWGILIFLEPTKSHSFCFYHWALLVVIFVFLISLPCASSVIPVTACGVWYVYQIRARTRELEEAQM